MPLAEIMQVLAHRRSPHQVDALLTAHLCRLEQGLVDARRELSAARSLLDTQESSMAPSSLTFAGPDFASALAAVRYAVSLDAEFPTLGGVLLDIAGGSVPLVATDRYRLAAATISAHEADTISRAVVLPATFADTIATSAAPEISLMIDTATITARAGSVTVRGELILDQVPDYRRLLPTNDEPAIPIDVELCAAVAVSTPRTMEREHDGVSFPAVVLVATADDQIVVSDQLDGVGVIQEFLLEAIDAGGESQLWLSLDGPVSPLVIRSSRAVRVLMPVRM
ncbi:hypothetical protein [Pseudonocardia spinosispora]|uniref:DNA polymerase III subunit beta family protein n=1 Tax=Pseudonocardia spinosispora TaxID=103441 RepID=UPI0006883E83|nr:hypothetical protein [Pseudonocardia spinosispora]